MERCQAYIEILEFVVSRCFLEVNPEGFERRMRQMMK